MDTFLGVGAALSVSLITDVLGGYLSIQDLKSCRMVSKNWYNWFSPSFRKNAKLIISRLNDIQKLTQHHDPNYQISRHKRVVLKLSILDGLKIDKHFNIFWTSHGENLTYLRMENVETCDLEILKDVLYRQTPNLKTLVLLNCFRGIGDGKKLLVQMNEISEEIQQISLKSFQIEDSATFLRRKEQLELLKIFLRIYPNITTLRLNRYVNCLECGQQFLGDIFTHLADVRKSSHEKYNFEELDIYYAHPCEERIEMPFFTALHSAQFPLKRLTIDFGNKTEINIAAGILYLYRESLQELSIFRPASSHPYAYFPFGIELQSLKVLQMSDCVASNLGFLRLMPKLERLHICGWKEKKEFLWMPELSQSPEEDHDSFKDDFNIVERTTVLDMEGVEVKGMKEFTFAYANCSSKMQDKVSRWMPNAKIKMYGYTI